MKKNGCGDWATYMQYNYIILLIQMVYTVLFNHTDNREEMERSLLTRCQRILRHLLLCTLLTFVAVHLSTSMESDETTSICTLEKVSVRVEYNGCEPRAMRVPVCNGVCISSTTAILEPPLLNSTCRRCTATLFKTKPVRLKFICGGQEVEHRMYFSYIEECGCRQCSAGLDN